MYAKLEKFMRTKIDIGADALQAILSCFKPVYTRKNEILLNPDQVCRHYYFINKGCIRLFTVNRDGNESSRYFAFEENLATALPSFIDQRPAEEYLQTIEKSELLAISRTDFYHLTQTIPQFAKIYTEILELGFITAQKRIYGFQGFDALQKVKWIMEHQPHLLTRISNKMAASYLGLSPSTLSRIKSKW
ncbi:Crp/Fnr family transcriptional regulator [Kaistella sp.]|uniref:Crp/Fnr family transcriptional regulator n=1 Tax=Kaistella sp. TaxID=2782235 RepID=UPI002F922EA6